MEHSCITRRQELFTSAVTQAIVLVNKVHPTEFMEHVKPLWSIVAIETGPSEAGKSKSLKAAATAGPQPWESQLHPTEHAVFICHFRMDTTIMQGTLKCSESVSGWHASVVCR